MYPDRLNAGLKKIEEFILEVMLGKEKYDSYSTEIAKRYEGNDPEQDSRLSAEAMKAKLPEIREKHRKNIAELKSLDREFRGMLD